MEKYQLREADGSRFLPSAARMQLTDRSEGGCPDLVFETPDVPPDNFEGVVDFPELHSGGLAADQVPLGQAVDDQFDHAHSRARCPGQVDFEPAAFDHSDDVVLVGLAEVDRPAGVEDFGQEHAHRPRVDREVVDALVESAGLFEQTLHGRVGQGGGVELGVEVVEDFPLQGARLRRARDVAGVYVEGGLGEVYDFDPLPLLVEEEVAGLYVPVDHAALVQVLDGLNHLVAELLPQPLRGVSAVDFVLQGVGVVLHQHLGHRLLPLQTALSLSFERELQGQTLDLLATLQRHERRGFFAESALGLGLVVLQNVVFVFESADDPELLFQLERVGGLCQPLRPQTLAGQQLVTEARPLSLRAPRALNLPLVLVAGRHLAELFGDLEEAPRPHLGGCTGQLALNHSAPFGVRIPINSGDQLLPARYSDVLQN